MHSPHCWKSVLLNINPLGPFNSDSVPGKMPLLGSRNFFLALVLESGRRSCETGNLNHQVSKPNYKLSTSVFWVWSESMLFCDICIHFFFILLYGNTTQLRPFIVTLSLAAFLLEWQAQCYPQTLKCLLFGHLQKECVEPCHHQKVPRNVQYQKSIIALGSLA